MTDTLKRALGGLLILPILPFLLLEDIWRKYGHRAADWAVGPIHRRAPGVRQCTSLFRAAKTKIRVAYWKRRKAKEAANGKP